MNPSSSTAYDSQRSGTGGLPPPPTSQRQPPGVVNMPLDHVLQYPLELQWPPTFQNAKNKPLRTNQALLERRLLQAGLQEFLPQGGKQSPELPSPQLLRPATIQDVARAAQVFVQELEQTGCFKSVQVELGQRTTWGSPRPQHTCTVTLDEANWYRLHLGGGVKVSDLQNQQQGHLWEPQQQPSSATSDDTQQHPLHLHVPPAGLDAALGLRNVFGGLDWTEAQYSLDTQQLATWTLTHTRPMGGRGSQGIARAVLDRLDYSWTRGYQEVQRRLCLRASNIVGGGGISQHAPVWLSSWFPNGQRLFVDLEWNCLWRHVIPQQPGHQQQPNDNGLAARTVSSELQLEAAHPSVKHSLSAHIRSAPHFLDHARNPTDGHEYHATAEVAIPPGTMGFLKCQGGASVHVPVRIPGEDRLFPNLDDSNDNNGGDSTTTTAAAAAAKSPPLLSFHGSLSAGILRHVSFGGHCQPARISDRFFVGGPCQLRGFSPSGIGPRSDLTSSSAQPTSGYLGGNALGGDFYVHSMLAASLGLPPPLPALRQGDVRLFGFLNAGTCVASVWQSPLYTLLQSTRYSVGVGLGTAILGPRIEVTYALPLRDDPRDLRQKLQFGMSLTFE